MFAEEVHAEGDTQPEEPQGYDNPYEYFSDGVEESKRLPTRTTYYINGVAIPITAPGYVNGVYTANKLYSVGNSATYFTKTGSACTHHGTGCYSTCSCQRYSITHNGVTYYYRQCWGFAALTQRAIWNPNNNANWKDPNSNNAVYVSALTTVNLPAVITPEDYTAAVWCEIIKYIPVGTHIRLNNDHHSLVLVEKTATTVTVYQANVGGQCKVNMATYTYPQFADWGIFSWYNIGSTTGHNHVAKGNYIITETTHHKVCGFSGCTHHVGEATHLYRITDTDAVYHTYTCRFCGRSYMEHHYPHIANNECSKCGRPAGTIFIPIHTAAKAPPAPALAE